MQTNIHPIPEGKGLGFSSSVPLDYTNYDYRPLGRYHNYHFTPQNLKWPLEITVPQGLCIDAFSPNLNKQLHVGHLRNLAIAASLHNTLTDRSSAQFVAFLGKSLGVDESAEENLKNWYQFLNYKPTIFYDTDVSEKYPVEGIPGEGEYLGCQVWPGAKHPTVIRRTDGRTTYAYHDLAFAKAVGPTHYLTGAEQFEHFANLDMAEKHLPMGLVLDPKTGKKMKSRDGNALSAAAALELVMSKLKETPEPKKLAWNVIAWNFLRVNRPKDVAFDVDNWTQPDAPGLYITYTHTRLMSALKNTEVCSNLASDINYSQADMNLLGYQAYENYYLQKAITHMDPSSIANFAHELAKKLNLAYHAERIKDGRPAFKRAVYTATNTLYRCMSYLGMFSVDKV